MRIEPSRIREIRTLVNGIGQILPEAAVSCNVGLMAILPTIYNRQGPPPYRSVPFHTAIQEIRNRSIGTSRNMFWPRNNGYNPEDLSVLDRFYYAKSDFNNL